MNKTVRNLARQADELARAMEPDLREIVRYNRIRDEKFAELIVRECANYITEYYPHSRYEAFYMKKHFGVEE